ncbi:MAG TPA: NAD(P) transhydrogenase subunit alpha [Acidimicrobiales bacterium]|jgi:NAD(P) transhydrogenase subunit alpha|nr:NAD(P) transhydrogenase subunit alpha [Acidimicrobiales bacterium]
MSTGIIAFVTVFVLAAFVGNEVISKVPSVLHTPLMSGSNAIHGIILVGTMIVMGEARGAAQITLAFIAVLLATLNVVGGFVVTDRMLEMFKGKPSDRPRPAAGTGTSAASPTDAPTAPGGPSAPGTPDTSGDSTPGDAK